MKKFLISILSLILIITTITCKKTNSVSSNNTNNNNQDTIKPQSTPIGTPFGSPTSKIIGASGGTIVSGDGSVELDIPAGALTGDTTISIQPITNNCPNGTSIAYRFTPNGLKFSQSPTLKFHYPDSVLNGTISALMGITFQDSSGHWLIANKSTNDTIAHTIEASIQHFTDYSETTLIRIETEKEALKPNEYGNLYINFIAPDDSYVSEYGWTQLVILYVHYTASQQLNMPPIIWEVNDITNGNSQYGTITGDADVSNLKALYNAPATVPSKNNPVTIKATLNKLPAIFNGKEYFTYNGQSYDKFILYTHIRIYDGGYHVELTYEEESDNESGTFWDITDTSTFDVLQSGGTASGAIAFIKNEDATLTYVSNDGTTCTVHPMPASGPLHVLDSGIVLVNPADKNITVFFNNALNPKYYVPFPSWKYECGSDQGVLGGGLGPPFPNYLQFGIMDIVGTVETAILTPQYKMVVTRY